MTTARLGHYISAPFKTKKIKFWFVIRVIASFGPIILTYIFSRGIAALEDGLPFNKIIQIFLVFLLIAIVEHFIRIASKTRLAYYTEAILVVLQKDLMKELDPVESLRKRTVQTLRNLTRAIRRFVQFLLNRGIPGFVSFIAIPIILFFIDRQVFLIEMLMIALYLLFTFMFSVKYEKIYEQFDRAREKYFSSFILSNNVSRRAKHVIATEKSVQDFRFGTWVTLQNMISVFQFIIVILVAHDVFSGSKQISDLILIVGYTRESKVFLNDVTGVTELYMEVVAGVERVVVVSQKKIRSIA